MISGARYFPKLSNEYLFAKNGFIKLLEFDLQKQCWFEFKKKNRAGKLEFKRTELTRLGLTSDFSERAKEIR
jgi:hypothetical protein